MVKILLKTYTKEVKYLFHLNISLCVKYTFVKLLTICVFLVFVKNEVYHNIILNFYETGHFYRWD
jgi:hypothetical protein